MQQVAKAKKTHTRLIKNRKKAKRMIPFIISTIVQYFKLWGEGRGWSSGGDNYIIINPNG